MQVCEHGQAFLKSRSMEARQTFSFSGEPGEPATAPQDTPGAPQAPASLCTQIPQPGRPSQSAHTVEERHET